MNKICKEYISDAKKFFPIMGKNERGYLRGIISELEDCIERESITTKQELYVKYRQPYDLANDYYSRFETDEIVKKIRIAKYIKIFISVFILVLLVVSIVFIFDAKILRDSYKREEMVGYDNANTISEGFSDRINSKNYESLIKHNNNTGTE